MLTQQRFWQQKGSTTRRDCFLSKYLHMLHMLLEEGQRAPFERSGRSGLAAGDVADGGFRRVGSSLSAHRAVERCYLGGVWPHPPGLVAVFLTTRPSSRILPAMRHHSGSIRL